MEPGLTIQSSTFVPGAPFGGAVMGGKGVDKCSRDVRDFAEKPRPSMRIR